MNLLNDRSYKAPYCCAGRKGLNSHSQDESKNKTGYFFTMGYPGGEMKYKRERRFFYSCCCAAIKLFLRRTLVQMVI